jgi:transposase
LVKPYRRGSKTDRADTKALLEAYRNEEIRPVPIKSVHQHLLAALHCIRSGWLSARTARINTVRGILRELGHFIPKGARFVVPAVTELIENPDSDLPDALRAYLDDRRFRGGPAPLRLRAPLRELPRRGSPGEL